MTENTHHNNNANAAMAVPDPQAALKTALAAALKSHDWYYMMSDDGRVYRKGQQTHDSIKQKVRLLGEVGQQMYDAARPK